MEILKRFIREDEGASAAEYAIILAVIAGLAYAAFAALGSAITGKVSEVTGYISS